MRRVGDLLQNPQAGVTTLWLPPMKHTFSCFLTSFWIDMPKTLLIFMLSSTVQLPCLSFSEEKSAADGSPEDCGKAPVFTCTVDQKTFRFVFRSVSNDCTNDDMQVTANNKVLNLPPAWYFETTDVSKNASSICKYDRDSENNGGYTAYPVGNQFLGIVKTKRGYRIPILVEAAENEFSCDCDAGTVSSWMEVTFDKNRIHKRWMRAPWKP